KRPVTRESGQPSSTEGTPINAALTSGAAHQKSAPTNISLPKRKCWTARIETSRIPATSPIQRAIMPRMYLRRPFRRTAGRPCPRLPVRPGRQNALVPRHPVGILRRLIRQHRRERRVVLEIVEHQLVVGVPVGVPGVLPVFGVVRLQPERRYPAAQEG